MIDVDVTTDFEHELSRVRDDNEGLVMRLTSTGDYRILRRLQASWIASTDRRSSPYGIFLDTETTGLDHSSDTVIELAMLPFDYAPDGRVLSLGEPFVGLRDPGRPIPAPVTALTGITQEMVEGSAIVAAEVDSFVREAAIVIAHNAAFDRPFCEKLWPVFASKPWGCSLREIPWSDEGFEGAKLCHLAAGHGFFFDGHRAVDDCRAGVEVLARPLPRSARTGLSVLLASARCPRIRLRAVGAPYGLRGVLKARGYRWSGGEDGRAKGWFVDVDEAAQQDECAFLRQEIYGREDATIETHRITAWDRYSERC